VSDATKLEMPIDQALITSFGANLTRRQRAVLRAMVEAEDREDFGAAAGVVRCRRAAWVASARCTR